MKTICIANVVSWACTLNVKLHGLGAVLEGAKLF